MSAELVKQVKRFLGVPMEDDVQAEIAPTIHQVEEKPAPTQEPLRKRPSKPANNIIDMTTSLSQSEMMIMEPKSFDDASHIVESLRHRKAVIVNLGKLDGEQAQRLIDFVAGATYALDGHQEQIGEGIFLFSPSNVVINALGSENPWLTRDARELFWRVN